MKRIDSRETILELVPDLLYDESRASGGVPASVFFPETAEDVQAILREASETETPVIFSGAQTGITAGSTPTDDCFLVSFTSMNKILDITVAGDTTLAHCQPGITLEELEIILLSHGEELPDIPGKDLLQQSSLVYAPDPTEMSAALGGTIATNASGARTFLYGATRKHVEDLSLVLANGDTLTVKRGDVTEKDGAFTFTTDQGRSMTVPAPDYPWPWKKNASGYYSAKGMDLVDLFIGSEGTLGVITSAGIILTKRPEVLSGVSFFPDRAAAFSFARFLRAEEGVMSIEYFDGTALDLLRACGESISLHLPEFPPEVGAAIFWEYAETEDAPLEEQLERWEEALNAEGSSLDLTWSGFDDDEKARLKTFRHAVPEIINTRIADAKRLNPNVRKVSTDAAVAEDRFEELIDGFFGLLEPSELDFAVFGHLGNFHLHFNMMPKDDEEMETAVKLYGKLMEKTIAAGGTVSAEHGIGKIKTAYLEKMYPAEAITRMRDIKTALDPTWILNRGTLLEYR